MKFDVIVGNPPYQYPKGIEPSTKLYIDITDKIIPLVKKDGTLTFITPQGILQDGRKNRVYKKIDGKIKRVDYTANNNFNIGQSVCAWTYIPNGSKEIEVVCNNKNYRVNNLFEVCREECQTLNKICNKISYRRNGRQQLAITASGNIDGIHNNYLSLEKQDNMVEVFHYSKKQNIQFVNPNLVSSRLKIIIPFMGGWETGCNITEKRCSLFFMVNKLDAYNKNTLEKIKIYLESKLISYAVVNYTSPKGIKPSQAYVFLSRLPELDFTRSWTDEELYKEFKLTQEEINEVEEWYTKWRRSREV